MKKMGFSGVCAGMTEKRRNVMNNRMRTFVFFLMAICAMCSLTGCKNKVSKLLDEYEQSINDYAAAAGDETIERIGKEADKGAEIEAIAGTLKENEQGRYEELADRFLTVHYTKRLEQGFIGEYRMISDLSDTGVPYTNGAAVLTVPNNPRPFTANIRTAIQYLGIDGFCAASGLDVSTNEGRAFRNMFRDFYNQNSNNVSSFSLVDSHFNICMLVVPSSLALPSSGHKQYLVYFQKRENEVIPNRIEKIVSIEELEKTDRLLFDFLKPTFDSMEKSVNGGTERKANYLY
jgi:hypothetical protein